VANYIKERTKNAQFIVISLRNNMFELAARLVGVYKVNHMTKSVTIENRDYVVRPGGSGQQQQHPAQTPRPVQGQQARQQQQQLLQQQQLQQQQLQVRPSVLPHRSRD
jgi:structural maintenance of chromosome 4